MNILATSEKQNLMQLKRIVFDGRGGGGIIGLGCVYVASNGMSYQFHSVMVKTNS